MIKLILTGLVAVAFIFCPFAVLACEKPPCNKPSGSETYIYSGMGGGVNVKGMGEGYVGGYNWLGGYTQTPSGYTEAGNESWLEGGTQVRCGKGGVDMAVNTYGFGFQARHKSESGAGVSATINAFSKGKAKAGGEVGGDAYGYARSGHGNP